MEFPKGKNLVDYKWVFTVKHQTDESRQIQSKNYCQGMFLDLKNKLFRDPCLIAKMNMISMVVVYSCYF